MERDEAKTCAAEDFADVADGRLAEATAEVLNRHRALLERLAADEG